MPGQKGGLLYKLPEDEPMTENVDRGVIRAAQSGNHDSFVTIFEAFNQAIYNYNLRVLYGNLELAFDLTQDTFVEAYQLLPSTAEGLTVRPWLHGIATNLCVDELRHLGALSWTPVDRLIHRFKPAYIGGDNPRWKPSGEQHVDEVQPILGQLPTISRIGLILCEYQDLSHDEIGSILHLNRRQVMDLLFRAREQFRQVYPTR